MGLFDSTRYFLASSIPPHRQEQLEYALSKNGATKAESIHSATHVISDSPWFEGVDILESVREERREKGEEAEIVVVSDYWVDRTLVLGKIQPAQYYSVDPAMIFSGIVACASELQAHDLEVLSAGISALGGQWRVALTNDVTHLFCITPSSAKYAVALAHRETTGIRIILPHWFDDSVKLGIRGLPVEPYSWPDPPFLKDIGVNVNKLGRNEGEEGEGKANCEGKEEERLKEKAKKNMMLTAGQFTPSASNPKVPLPKDADLLPVKRGVFDNKRILLSWTLSLYGSRREAVEVGIRRAGGVVLRYPGDGEDDLTTEEKEKRRDRKEARAVVECDILITRWRNGKAYGKAFKLHKTIATMAWLYHVQSSGLMPRPVDQLLHYPVPRKPIEGFSQHEITVTNYTGEAREYIKRIITAMGAKFTPMMTGRNTVLIAAYIHGQKTDKARAWSLPIVNHTWLEDCFIQWRHLTMATDKYITFPTGVDFSRSFGERGVGVRGVELCDDEEMKEDEGSSEEEGVHVGMDVKMDGEQEDEVLKKNVEEDIDMISMPDTDDRGRDTTFEHVEVNGKTSPVKSKSASGSPTKRSVVPTSSSPTKQGATASSVMQVSPNKRTKSKSVSPMKKRKIVTDDEDEERMEVDQPARSPSDGVAENKKRQTKSGRTPRKSVAMDVSSSEEGQVQPVTPTKPSKPKPKSTPVTFSSSKKQSSVDLELTDESENEELEMGVSELVRSSAAARAKAREQGSASPKKKRRVDTNDDDDDEDHKGRGPSAKKPISRVDDSSEGGEEEEEEEEETVPKAKKRFVRRLTSETSLQLAEEREKERAEGSSTKSKQRLVRRASAKTGEDAEETAQHDEENLDKSSKEQKEEEKADTPASKPGGLLRTTRGDARTRVKAKSAGAKARELYSDSESEVEGLVGPEALGSSLPAKGKAKGKGKGRATKSNRGLKSKSKRVSSSSEEEVEVESESEDEETSKKRPPATTDVSPSRKMVSVVVELPPPSARKHPLKNTYGGTANKAKKKARGDEDETEEEEEEEPPSKSRTKRESAIKKADSIFVEAGEAQGSHFTSTSRPKPKLKPKPKSSLSKPTTSSPLSSIDNAPPNANSTDTTDYNTASETQEPLPARRGAAAKAEAKLKEMMPDATRYEQEAKRARKSGGWTSLWEKELERQVKDKEKEEKGKEKENRKKRASDVSGEDVEERVAKKRRRSSAVKGEEEEGGGEVEVVISEVRKGKTKVKRESDTGTSPTRSNKVYLMTTQVTLGADVVKALDKLGVVMASKASQCTHLIAPNLVRTEKFLCALASAPVVLQEAWAIKSAQVKQLLPFEKFLLRDAAAEKKYRMKLSDALARAKELKGTLLANKTFYLTAKTKVDYKLLKSVISAHGGQLLQQSPTVRQLTGHADRHIISCAEDISIWRPLAAQGVPIYTHEFLLIGVLRQELDWDLMEFRVAGSV